jgi:hypothetical protein
VGYVRYLLDTLAKRDLFSWLTLAPSRWWHCLLYRDAYNWGGVEATLPAGAWEATERRGGGGVGGGCDDVALGAELSALDAVDPTQVGTPGGPKLRWGAGWGRGEGAWRGGSGGKRRAAARRAQGNCTGRGRRHRPRPEGRPGYVVSRGRPSRRRAPRAPCFVVSDLPASDPEPARRA